ncbi:hypothetical protein JX266_008574 [Neoarthrinium moseri]|nr:hypothetical protein JX266_008574 [Neoarthrinium moseri]
MTSTPDSVKEELSAVLNKLGHPVCPDCTELALPDCCHNEPGSLRKELQGIFGKWNSVITEDGVREPTPVFYCLEEWRTMEDLSSVQLQQNDLVKLETAYEAAAVAGFDVYLAHVHMEQKGFSWDHDPQDSADDLEEEGEEDPETSQEGSERGANPDFAKNEPLDESGTRNVVVPPEEEVERQWSVEVLYQKDQKLIARLPLNTGELLQGPGFFDGEEPDDEEYEDDGNDWRLGASYTREFYALALAIVPRASIGNLLSGVFERDQPENAGSVLEYFATKCIEPEKDEQSFKVLRGVCSNWPAPLPDDERPWVAIRKMQLVETLAIRYYTIALLHEDQDLFDSVCESLEPLYTMAFYDWLGKTLKGTTLNLTALRQPITRNIAAIPRFGDRYVAVVTLDALHADAPTEMLATSIEALNASVKACEQQIMFEQDGETLLIAARFFQNLAWIESHVIPLIEKRPYDIAFAIGFSWQLYQFAEQGIFPKEEALSLVKTAVNSAIEHMQASLLLSMESWQDEMQRREQIARLSGEVADNNTLPPPPPMTSDTLINFVQILVDLKMTTELSAMIVKMTEQVSQLSEQELSRLYIPFLGKLMVKLSIHSDNFSSEATYQSLYLEMITAFWQKHITTEPQFNWSLQSQVLGCGCAACNHLNHFLQNPYLRTTRLESRRYDIHLARTFHSLAKQSWDARGSGVQAVFQAADQHHLATLLGIHYQTLVGLPPPGAPVSRTLKTTDANIRETLQSSTPQGQSIGQSQMPLVSIPSSYPQTGARNEISNSPGLSCSDNQPSQSTDSDQLEATSRKSKTHSDPTPASQSQGSQRYHASPETYQSGGSVISTATCTKRKFDTHTESHFTMDQPNQDMDIEPPMAGNISGPGCLYVESKISRSDILDEATYTKWYEEDHIPEILETSGIKSARRFRDIDPNADTPFLAIYPLEDVAFLTSDEFRQISVKSDLLPDTGLVYSLADFGVRYDNLIQVYDPTKKGKGHTKSIISAQIELKEDADAADFDRWYREEHLDLLSKAKGYLRSTRFKNVYARTNAQSRALKGLSTTDKLAAAPLPPVWLTIHEFEVESPDLAEMKALTASPWTERIYAERKLGIFKVYKLVAEFGQKDWFHGVDV